MSARVCTPPVSMLIDRMTPNVATPEAMGESSLPSSRTQEDDLILFGRRLGTTTGSETGRSHHTTIPTQQITKILNVSRNLFGTPHNATQIARDKMKVFTKKSSERWNFDFETGKPLPGRYVWEQIPTIVTTSPAGQSTTSSDTSTARNLRPRPFSSSSPPLSEPTQPKQRRIDVSSNNDPLFIARPVPVSGSSSTSSSSPESSSKSIKSTTTIETKIESTKSSPKTPLSFPSGQQPKPSPIPANILVKTIAVDPLDGEQEEKRKYLKNDSSSRMIKSKQVKITMYNAPVKRRRIGQPPAAEKKAAF